MGIILNADCNGLCGLDGTVSGTVNASFFGDNASEIGGVADIVKTQTVTQPSVVSENIAGYTDAVHVTTFSANLQIPKEKGI
jgi:hypothetical protein